MHTAFNTANFAFRQVGYRATGDWGQACRTSREHFAPIETFEARFGALLDEVAALDFQNVELWHFHLHQNWWTPEHVEIVRRAVRARDMRLVAYCGGFGDDLAEFGRTLDLVGALGVSVLAGASKAFREERAACVEVLRARGVRFAYENHAEKTPAEVLAKLGSDDADVVGVTVDTGWFGTQGYPAHEALRELVPRLMHVHLKDVREVGAHDTCAFGQGVVPIDACVRTLADLGYTGYLSVEHEPDQFDPTSDLRAARAQLGQLLEVQG